MEENEKIGGVGRRDKGWTGEDRTMDEGRTDVCRGRVCRRNRSRKRRKYRMRNRRRDGRRDGCVCGLTRGHSSSNVNA